MRDEFCGACIVHECIQPTPLLHGLVYQTLTVFVFRYISLTEQDFGTQFFAFGGNIFCGSSTA